MLYKHKESVSKVKKQVDRYNLQKIIFTEY